MKIKFAQLLTSMRSGTTSIRQVVTIASLLLLPYLINAQTTTLNVGGKTRTLFVYAPSGLTQNRPLVISMHGLGNVINDQRTSAKWELVADTAKFLVVYPQGEGNSWDISGNKDIDFLSAIIESMVTRFGIDRNRVYVTGFSMGGMMSYHAANKMADKVAAIGPVSGYLFGNPVTSSRPMPILHVHGMSDNVVYYGPNGNQQGIVATLQKWRTWNQCPSTGTKVTPYPVNRPNSRSIMETWGPCNNSTVQLLSIYNKYHEHSNDPAGVHTTNELWNFFLKQSLSTGPVITLTSPAVNATFTAPATINMTATASVSGGSISNVRFYNGVTLLSTDNAAPFSYSWTNVAAGTYTVRAVATDNQGKTAEATQAIKVNVPRGPYNGTAHTIPGTIQAEHFDMGGNGIAYFDKTPGSEVTPAINFRTNEDVDIEPSTDVGGGYNIAHAIAGEWLEYTVNVQTTGTYTMDLRVACLGDGRTISVSMDGTTIAANAAIPNTTAWQTWQTIRLSNISLTAGQKIMRVAIGALDYFNLNYVTFALVPSLVATITPAGPTTFCSGGNVILNAASGIGYTYQWKRDGNNIANATTSSYSATQSGSYTVTVSTNNQSTSSTATTVTVNALPVITPYAQIDGGTWNQVTTATVCAGSTVVLGPQPAANAGWTWTGPNGYTSTTREITLITVAANQGGVYTASYTDGNTCKSTVTFTLTVNAVAAAPTVTTAVSYCQNATATQLSAIGSNLKWYTLVLGGTALTNTPIPSTGNTGTTNYYVSQTTNSCESTRALIAVTVNALPTAAITVAGSTTIVSGGSVTLTASTGSSYIWKRDNTQVGTTQSYSATIAGSYTVEVTNASNCKATSSPISVTVNQNQPSLITINSPIVNSTLSGPITIEATVSDPDGVITKVEYLAGATVLGSSTSSPYNFIWQSPTSGNHEIRVRVTDSNGGVTTSLPVTVMSGTTTGIHSSTEIQLMVYPNPSYKEITLETEMDLTNAKITVINVLGQEMQVPSTVNVNGANIDVSSLTEGTYILIVRQENKVAKSKITIVK